MAGLSQAEAGLSKFTSSISTSQFNLKSLGLGMTAAGIGLVGLATAIGGTAIKAASDFDNMIVTVGNNAGMTGREIAELRQTVLDLSASTGATKEDLANAYMYIHDMGYAGKQASDLLAVATKEALATGTSIADTASVLATAMHSFSIPVADAAKTLDMLHTSAASARMTMQDFMSSFGPVGAQAAAIGIPLNQAAAAMAALTRNGFSAAESATQVRDMLVHMMAPTKSAQEELARLSGAASGSSKSHKDFSFQIMDTAAKIDIANQRLKEAQANHKTHQSTIMADQERIKELNHTLDEYNAKQHKGTEHMSASSKAAVNLAYDFTQQGLQAKGLTGVINDLITATHGNAEEMNKLIPNLRGGLGALVLTNKGHADFVDILKKEGASLGSTEAAYSKYSETTAAQNKRLTQEFNNATIALGEALLPTVNKFLEFVTPIVKGLTDWISHHQQLSTTIIAGVAIFGVLLTILGVVTMAIAAVGAPILAVSFAVGLLAGAFIVNFTKIRDFVGSVVTFLKKNFLDVMAFFGPGGLIAGSVIDFIAKFVENLTKGQNAFVAFKNAIGGMIGDLKNMFDDLAKKAADALSHINPLARHSPSLLDQVTMGVAAIKQQYASLGNIQVPNMAGSFALSQNYNSYQNVHQPNTTINNSFTIQGEENAVGFAEYLSFQLEHRGLV